MRPIFCGNFEYDARESDLERLFRKYGKVDRVDIKSGFAFVYMEDERDAEDAIRGLDQIEFGRKGRRLRVEWTRQERGGRRPESSRRSSGNSRPSKTLFVINFDPYNTRTRDLERHFDPYGKILNIRIRRNFAFIQYETLEDATRALEATSMSKLMDRVISVEYAIKDDDDSRKNGYSPDRSRDRSPGRRGHDRGRSPSPYGRERGSPDYGRGRGRNASPYRRERASPDYGRGPSPSPKRREKNSDYDHGSSPSSPREKSNPDNGCPPRERPNTDNDRQPSPQERASPDYDHGASPNPRRERFSADDYRHSASPDLKPQLRDSPRNDEVESPVHERYRSRSPLDRERSESE